MILILFVVLLQWVNELAMNDTAHVREMSDVFKRDCLGDWDLDGNMCTCIYCVFVLFHLCIFILICY